MGTMVTWSVDLSEFDIQYEPQTVIKAQALVDFLVEMVDEEESINPTWMLYVDGASSTQGCGAGVILEREGDIMIEMSIKFDFPVFNNQAEYEALIAKLQLTSDVRVTRFTICNDSQIITSQVSGSYQAKDPLLQKYLARVKELIGKIDISGVRHMQRIENVRADILSKLASTKTGGNNKSLIQETLKIASIAELASVVAIEENRSWMAPIIQYLLNGVLPSDFVSAKRLVKEASYYTIVGDELSKRGLSQPLSKCLSLDQVNPVLEEVHEGSYGHHHKGKVLELKILRAEYY